MKLWKLTRISQHPQYDVFNGHVIRADNEYRARQMADEKSADEGHIWRDPKKALCNELTADGPEGFQLSDFNAG